MSNDAKQTKPWLTVADLAEAFGCSAEEVETLARRNHWPSVHGISGAKFAVGHEDVKRALADKPGASRLGARLN